MDVDRANFWPKLPRILEAISEAQFVSIDLEMSGIVVKVAESRTNPDLPQIYQDAKAAAETFTILQFGLTCICWNNEKGAYVTKTFNLPVHPGFVGVDTASKQLARTVDRRVRFSSKSIAFLQDQGFSFADAFNKGVPYLSTAEASQKEIMAFIENKGTDEDQIDVSQLPLQTIEFYGNIQTKLREWSNKWLYLAEIEPLRIVNPHGGRLNNLQKRLIHQLVEANFKDCRAYSRAGSTYMEVMELEAKEQPVSGLFKAQRKQAVVRQTGLRFLWDAICGRLFANKIDTELIVGEDPVNMIQLRKDMKEYERRLRNRSPVYVGHNLLWDLCFLHRAFVGPLPEKLEDFRAIMRERLPRIVDTKYLFTRGGHEMLPDQNLAECFATVKGEEYPAVRPDPLYSYLKACPHQAGYDSYMTAVVFIKKSYQLSQAKQGLDFIVAEDSVKAIAPPRSSSTLTMPKPAHCPFRFSSLAVQAPRRVPAVPTALMAPRRTRTGSLLDDDNDVDSVAGLASYATLKPEVSPAKTTVPPAQETKPVGPARVPAWESTFWKRYGNKSRVGPFGHIFYTGGKD
ncbi:hypothetical protein VMCG_00752 [Cytospora schulzeri]|uniref:3'-5' exonuclease domain-containing protein n=1 Tax=Cytospora schulzeri TaxID=448051 RepID=A0A423X9P9_9PEZI|nr:hypothetical protein VMCG_00752 [Valsa malicola]